jgi:hypothetical protein
MLWAAGRVKEKERERHRSEDRPLHGFGKTGPMEAGGTYGTGKLHALQRNGMEDGAAAG